MNDWRRNLVQPVGSGAYDELLYGIVLSNSAIIFYFFLLIIILQEKFISIYFLLIENSNKKYIFSLYGVKSEADSFTPE